MRFTRHVAPLPVRCAVNSNSSLPASFSALVARRSRLLFAAPAAFVIFFTCALICAAQQPPPPAPAPQDSTTTFKLRVNLVLVRTVARDKYGQTVNHLTKDDFQIKDNGKPQEISSFSVESAGSSVPMMKMAGGSATAVSPADAAKAPALPQRYVALLFDDLHLAMDDTLPLRLAASKLFSAMQASDRLAIFTTSGHVQQDFTTDRAKLDQALQRITPNSRFAHSQMDCPPMTFYEAYSIVELNDDNALRLAAQEALKCAPSPEAARSLARNAAQREFSIGESDIHFSLANLDAVIGRISQLPGQRVMVLMSPGFFLPPSMHQSGESIDRATKANIVVNAIDARGLYVGGLFDASTNLTPNPTRLSLISSEDSAQSGVLQELADGTGGTFFHNRNDIDKGLLQAAAEPEVSYVLGFAPQNLKFDGKYHRLQVNLTNKEKWTLQARHGYFAPTTLIESDPARSEAAAKKEIKQAVFSHQEIRDFPIDCETLPSKTANGVHLALVVHITTKGLRFVRVGDHSNDNMTVVTALFDENGKMVAGLQKIVLMELTDATIERFNASGLYVKFESDLQPGTYLVRIAARDSEGGQMATMSRTLVLPK